MEKKLLKERTEAAKLKKNMLKLEDENEDLKTKHELLKTENRVC